MRSTARRCVIGVLAAMPWLSACPDAACAQGAVRHPDPRYVDATMPPTHRLRLAGPRSALPVVLDSAVLAAIGDEQGPDAFVFGEISGVALTSRGAVAVIDRRMHDLRIFDSTGRFLQRLGRRGQGPGEFRAPQSLLATARDELWVTDMQRRITEFTPSKDGYRRGRILPVEIGIRALCRLGDALVANVAGDGETGNLQVLDLAWRPQRAFGRIYRSPNAMLNHEFSEGMVACDAASGTIVHAASAVIGEVRGYRADGRLLWRTVIEGVRHSTVTETRDGGYQVTIGADGAHALASLHAIPGAGVLLQYEYRTKAQLGDDGPPTEVVTILIDPRTGAASLTSERWPRIAAVAGGRAVAVFEDPAPRLEVRALGRRP